MHAEGGPVQTDGDAETDLAAREGALTGAREQQREQQGVSEATTAGMPSGTTIPPPSRPC